MTPGPPPFQNFSHWENQFGSALRDKARQRKRARGARPGTAARIPGDLALCADASIGCLQARAALDAAGGSMGWMA